jgi:hypothetical protein
MEKLKNKLDLLNKNHIPLPIGEVKWGPIEIILNKQTFKKYNQYFVKIILKWNNLRNFLENIKHEIFRNSNLTVIFE